ncbi:AlkZ-related protein [Paenibacillus sp. 22594]|uniref:AlkZ-related protein n=1 Tax=Paenibacillus sp. 22594 TaxID=3453947 RepID=UPI003F84735C
MGFSTGRGRWLWRIRIVQEGVAAYGKFFGTKASFIHTHLFPLFRTIQTSNKTVDERFKNGLISKMSHHIYDVLSEHGKLPFPEGQCHLRYDLWKNYN